MQVEERLSQLSEQQRLELENVLYEFDRDWSPLELAAWVQRLRDAGQPDLLAAGFNELICIDIERQWQAGQQVTAESYLASYPELGGRDDLSPNVLRAEFEARAASGAKPTLAQFALRFPSQVERLQELVQDILDAPDPDATDFWPSERDDVTANDQASIQTSRSGAGDSVPSGGDGPSLPEHFGRYRVIRKLGAGAMGAVYLAEDTKLLRQVALKTPNFDGSYADEMIARFEQEAQSAATLHHAGICPVFDVGRIDGTHFLSMAFVDGRPLSDYVKSGKEISKRSAVSIVRKLALALQHAHEQGVVHRDLKPANIMISKQHEPIVMDFGLALQSSTPAEARITQSGQIVGTPAYMSPEQIDNTLGEVGPHTDIYSLSVILYELITGQLPFTGSVTNVIGQILTKDAAPLCGVREDVEPELEAICRRGMSKQAANRFESMRDMADALGDYLKFRKSQDEPDSGSAEADALTGEDLPATAGSGAVATQRAGTPMSGTAIVPPPPPPPALRPTKAQPEAARIETRRRTRLLVSIAAIGVVLFGVWYIVTNRGTVKITLDDDTAAVMVNDDQVSIGTPDKPIELRVGEHGVKIMRDGEVVHTEKFKIRRKQQTPVTITLDAPDEASTKPLEFEADSNAPPPLAEAPFNADQALAHQKAWARHLGVPVEFTDEFGIKFRLIPPGRFNMRVGSDEPSRPVRLTEPFYLGVTEITVKQFRLYRERFSYKTRAEKNTHGGGGFHGPQVLIRSTKYHFDNPGYEQTDEHPAGYMAWQDAMNFCSGATQQTGAKYDLPTEAQWAFAARAGTVTRWWTGDEPSSLQDAENLLDQSVPASWTGFGEHRLPWNDGWKQTAPVASFRANPFGLFDMEGNVSEHCRDSFTRNFPTVDGDLIDPIHEVAIDDRTFRGLRMRSVPTDNSLAAFRGARNRFVADNYVGFRVTRDVASAPRGDTLPVDLLSRIEGDGTGHDRWSFRGKVLSLRDSDRSPGDVVSGNTARWVRESGLHGGFMLTFPLMKTPNEYDLQLKVVRRQIRNDGRNEKPPSANANGALHIHFIAPNGRFGMIAIDGYRGAAYAYSSVIGDGVWGRFSDTPANRQMLRFDQPRNIRLEIRTNGLRIVVDDVLRAVIANPDWSKFPETSHGFSPRFGLGARYGYFDVLKFELVPLPEQNSVNFNGQGDSNIVGIGNPPPPADSPFSEAEAIAHQTRWAEHLGMPVELKDKVGHELRLIPPGSFDRGTDDPNAIVRLRPKHRVTVTRPFYIAAAETTAAQFIRFWTRRDTSPVRNSDCTAAAS